MGLFDFFSKEKKESLDKGLEKSKESLFGKLSRAIIGKSTVDEEVLDELAQAGQHHVLVAPIGFLCDHVETLYDIDIELTQLARTKGIQLERIPMLNASAPLIDILTSVVEAHESSLVH